MITCHDIRLLLEGLQYEHDAKKQKNKEQGPSPPEEEWPREKEKNGVMGIQNTNIGEL